LENFGSCFAVATQHRDNQIRINDEFPNGFDGHSGAIIIDTHAKSTGSQTLAKVHGAFGLGVIDGVLPSGRVRFSDELSNRHNLALITFVKFMKLSTINFASGKFLGST
jgi:hypothetical protein